MNRSTDRILTTHVGSLIRRGLIRQHLRAKQTGEALRPGRARPEPQGPVAEVVRQQAEVGVDVISDGEFGKGISWSQYVLERVSAASSAGRSIRHRQPVRRGADRERFSEFYDELDARDRVETVMDSVAVAPITYTGQALLQQDIDNFKAALAKAQRWSRASCRSRRRRRSSRIARTNIYKNDEDLAGRSAQAMRDRIQADHRQRSAGAARRRARRRHLRPHGAAGELRRTIASGSRLMSTWSTDAIEGIPREKIRYHVCWGSWPGPHTTDVPLATSST